jgi:hypothetical protein
MKFKNLIIYNEMLVLKPEKINLKFLELKETNEIDYEILKFIDISKINLSEIPLIDETPKEFKNFLKNKTFKKTFDDNLSKIKQFIKDNNIVLFCIGESSSNEAFFIQENEIFWVNINPDDSVSFVSRSLNGLKSFIDSRGYSFNSRPKINTSRSLSKVFDIIEFLCKKINLRYFLIRGQDKIRQKLYEKFLPKRFQNIEDYSDGGTKYFQVKI